MHLHFSIPFYGLVSTILSGQVRGDCANEKSTKTKPSKTQRSAKKIVSNHPTHMNYLHVAMCGLLSRSGVAVSWLKVPSFCMPCLGRHLKYCRPQIVRHPG